MSAGDLFREILDAGWEGVEAWKRDAASETSDLEFKTSDWRGSKLNPADKKNLGRTASAFANTEGGVIVFGVKTKKTEEGADRVTDIQEIEKLQLFVDKINEHVRLCTDPTVPGVKAEAIYKPGAEDMGVAAVLVPESDGGPHRAKYATPEWDDRYFIRAGTSTGVMAHTTLAAMFGRPPAPKLKLRLRWEGMSHGSAAILRVRITNEGRGPGRQPAIQIATPGVSLGWELTRAYAQESEWRRLESHIDDVYALLIQASPKVVIYPGLDVEVASATVGAGTTVKEPIKLRGFVYAMGASREGFEVTLEPGVAAEVVLP